MTEPIVYIVDDDVAVRDSVSLLCETANLRTECHDSGESFLAAFHPGMVGCLILDVRMNHLSGLELQAELALRASALPIIFLTAHGDIPMTVRAMKAGAADFLTKPINGAELLQRVQAALQIARFQLDSATMQEQRYDRLANLTLREHETMMLALAGHTNKAIAKELGISHRTVEIHRSRILQKTGAANMIELAQLAIDCGLRIPRMCATAAPDDEPDDAQPG